MFLNNPFCFVKISISPLHTQSCPILSSAGMWEAQSEKQKQLPPTSPGPRRPQPPGAAQKSGTGRHGFPGGRRDPCLGVSTASRGPQLQEAGIQRKQGSNPAFQIADAPQCRVEPQNRHKLNRNWSFTNISVTISWKPFKKKSMPGFMTKTQLQLA